SVPLVPAGTSPRPPLLPSTTLFRSALRLPPLAPAIELRSFEARDGKDCPIARQRPDSGRSREARRRSASTAAHGRNGRIPTPRPDKRRGLRIPSPALHGTEGAGNHG